MRYFLSCCELFLYNRIEFHASKLEVCASLASVVFILASGFAGGVCRCNVASADGASGTTWNWDRNEFSATKAGTDISNPLGREPAAVCRASASHLKR
jgi:hypothetical protein